MKIAVAVIAACAALSGCASTIAKWDAEAAAEREAEAKLQQQVDLTIPICSSDVECARMWDAAQVWVQKNSTMKIQTVSSAVIQTYTPSFEIPGLGFSITKEPIEGGRYKIVGKSSCAGIGGCDRSPLQALLDFNTSIGAIRN